MAPHCAGEGDAARSDANAADALVPSDGSIEVVDGSLADASMVNPDATIPPPQVPEGFSARFVWPVAGWIGANHNYIDGPHSGSADITVPYWTPVGAAREGTVDLVGWYGRGGYLVYIAHSNGYRTLYSHLGEPPMVKVGDRVTTGQTIGYSGRTGNAWRNGAHLHFAIFRNDTRLIIPGLELGDWVQRGNPIAGSYDPLADTDYPGEQARFDVRVEETALLRRGPSQTDGTLAEVPSGVVLRVLDSSSGYYQVAYGDDVGWLVHVQTKPVRSDLRTTHVTANPANVREKASTDSAVVGTLANGSLVTVLEQAGDWCHILIGVPMATFTPAMYAWTHASNLEGTVRFSTRIRSTSVNVRAAPDVSSEVIGSLSLIDPIDVLATEHGWYRIRFQGQPAWVAGWHTQGPL